jgi:hypothetical protein
MNGPVSISVRFGLNVSNSELSQFAYLVAARMRVGKSASAACMPVSTVACDFCAGHALAVILSRQDAYVSQCLNISFHHDPSSIRYERRRKSCRLNCGQGGVKQGNRAPPAVWGLADHVGRVAEQIMSEKKRSTCQIEAEGRFKPPWMNILARS